MLSSCIRLTLAMRPGYHLIHGWPTAPPPLPQVLPVLTVQDGQPCVHTLRYYYIYKTGPVRVYLTVYLIHKTGPVRVYLTVYLIY